MESVRESSNDAGMPWIRNKCYFNQNLPRGHTKKGKTLLIRIFSRLRNWLLLYAAVRWVNQLQQMQQECGSVSRTWQDRRQDRTDHLRVPLCASEIGLHFRPGWSLPSSLPPFILNGALVPQKPHCVSEQLSSPEGPSEGAPLEPHRYSFYEIISCITSLHKYFTGLWSKPTSVSLCLLNCFGSYMCILDVSSPLKLALQKASWNYKYLIFTGLLLCWAGKMFCTLK